MADGEGFTDEQRDKLELLTEAFSTDEIKALANYDVEHVVEQTGMTRRQVLGVGAMLAGGGALGGYAATEAINPAQAQADTGDSDGNVGLPTDRVDVFADGIDSNSLSTDKATINDYSAELTKSSDQSINADTDTTIDWGTQDLDTDLYSYDTSTDELTVLEPGDYSIESSLLTTDTTDNTEVDIYIKVNGGIHLRSREVVPGGTSSQQSISIGGNLKDLSENDAITIEIRPRGESGTVVGSSMFDYATVERGA